MKNKVVELKAILNEEGLSSGYSFRGKIRQISNGEIRVIQLKDFIDEYAAIGNECYLISADKIKPKYYLENGDILFIAKGTNNYALVFTAIDDIPTIASSALFVIKVNKEVADPHYVAWYINQNPVQNYLKTNETGTYVTSINKATVVHIPIKLPSLDLQKQIARLAQLHIKEKQLTAKITNLKESLITNQLLNTL
ncbi:restriction endonuclease subunit S [Zunongwangia sp. SCSIO 43204]|uniref:restriction endonuclease subunit S n=1 Tax=Zunongwangia sp. SCSIO 43204 TaxID=2779359 RepID=UPI001CA94D12|nr:restriction endonuclease subunit S [Zunongwangia sp. SCSIO 43204]UAB82858.1 restriction endonuclease subunit S [Zunongwangia sp. SCSIO 43204]